MVTLYSSQVVCQVFFIAGLEPIVLAPRYGGWRGNGNGSSIQVYFQFTVFGGALFLTKFLFPVILRNKMMKHSGRREWTKLAVVKAMLWWILGLTLLSCAGWMWNGLILLAIALAKSVIQKPFRVAHFVHNVFCGMGYFGTLLLGGLLWYQNPHKTQNLEDTETKFGMFRVVWIRRLQCEREDEQPTAIPAKNHPVFPYCREIMLTLLTAFCLVFGTWLISGLTKCD